MDIIFSSYDQFFEAEKKVAGFIINNKEKVLYMNVAELAQASGASDATVSRFCKKCGMKGFHHLKFSLAQELAAEKGVKTNVSNDISIDNLSQSLQNILANKIEELEQTIFMMDVENLKTILKVIENANSIQTVAVGNTIPVALDASYKFNQIGIKTMCNTIWETQLGYAYNLSEKDVVLVISNSGESKRLISIINAAKVNKAVTISITSSEKSSIAKATDYHITTATREKLFMDEHRFSRVSAMMVIEILYLLLIVASESTYKSIS